MKITKKVNAATVPFTLGPEELNDPKSLDLGKLARTKAKEEDDRLAKEAEEKRKEELRRENADLFDTINGDGTYEDKLQALFDKLVPVSGKAEIVAGEIARALMKILYRWYNDGDKVFEGYGIETCGEAATFLSDTIGDEIDDIIDFAAQSTTGFNEKQDNEIYKKMMDKLIEAAFAWMNDNPDKCFDPAVDMFEWKDVDWLYELEPRVEVDVNEPTEGELGRYLYEFGDEVRYSSDEALNDLVEDLNYDIKVHGQFDLEDYIDGHYRDCVIYNVPRETEREIWEYVESWLDNKLRELEDEFGTYDDLMDARDAEEEEEYEDEEEYEEEE